MVKVFHATDFDKLLEKLDLSRLGKKVGVKIHFGERGCKTYVRPELVKKLCDLLKQAGKEPVLIECNVLYLISRTRASTHIQLAKEHGFDFAPIHILDGERGDESVELDGCTVGKGIKDYDSLIVFTHFKGHGNTGFGGAVKNLGMGLGSREGKMDMHASLRPFVLKNKCIGCKKCAEGCSTNAISFPEGKAHIMQDECIGCAMCMCICPEHAISVPYSQNNLVKEITNEKIREYALAIIKHIGRDKVTFINVLENITEQCDCAPYLQRPIMPDKGYLLSGDIDAVDLASLKLTNNLNGTTGPNAQVMPVEYEIKEIQ